MNKRKFLTLLGLFGIGGTSIAFTPVKARSIHPGESIEPVVCINPWQQSRRGDALVKPSEIISAEFIESGAVGPWTKCGWLDVRTSDGRHLQSEFEEHQTDVRSLTQFLEHRGVAVKYLAPR